MANAIPLLEGTDAAGGYLVPDGIRTTLVNAFARSSAIPALVTPEIAFGKRDKYVTYAGRPTVAVVGEGAQKPVTGAEYGSLTVDIKKFASIVLYSQELIEDAREDPNVLVNQDVRGAFANAIDANALGMAAGAAIVGTFNHELSATTSTVELGTGNDALAIAVSAAMATIEANGGNPNGVAVAADLRGAMRDARDGDGRPLYGTGFNQADAGGLYGLNWQYTTNLDALPAGAGKVAAVVGDFTHAKLLIRSDISMDVSNTATVYDGTTNRNLWQENLVGVRWEMRAGFAAHDLNRMFVAIINAS